MKPTKTESPFPYGRVCVAWLGKKARAPCKYYFLYKQMFGGQKRRISCVCVQCLMKEGSLMLYDFRMILSSLESSLIALIDSGTFGGSLYQLWVMGPL